MEWINKELTAYRALPVSLRFIWVASLIVFVCTVLLFFSVAAGARVDPGTATLIGEVVGFCVIALQLRASFNNLIRSQEHRAGLERDAREHQHEIDLKKMEEEQRREKAILLSALRAELLSLHAQADNSRSFSHFGSKIYDAFASQKLPNSVKKFPWPKFETPIYKANLQRLGILGTSLAADVILMCNRAGGEQIDFGTTISNDMAAEMYKAAAKATEEWMQELHHVAMRIQSVEEGTPDPGTLTDFRAKRNS